MQRRFILRVVIFAFSTLLMVSGYFLSKAEQLNFVMKAVAPDYCAAKHAVGDLEQIDTLVPGDLGFEQISNIMLRRLTLQVPAPVVQFYVKIDRIFYIGSQGSYASASGITTRMPVYFEPGIKGDSLKMDLQEIKEAVTTMKNEKIMTWSVILFVCGLLFNAINFWWLGQLLERQAVKRSRMGKLPMTSMDEGSIKEPK